MAWTLIAESLLLETPSAPRRDRPTVVIIDDEASMRALLRLYLVNAGYDVQEAEDGVRGCYVVMACMPDLVICDMHMPRMSGLELLAALKQDPPTRHIPVVLLTGDDDALAAARAAGAAECLRKPVPAAQLLRVAEAFLGHALLQHGASPGARPTTGA